MSTFNMPPGVSTNDIPGNRSEDEVAPEEIIVVVWRHPDASNSFSVFVRGQGIVEGLWSLVGGHGVRIIDVDMGASFDGYPREDTEEWREWREAVLDSVSDLPADHGARLSIEKEVQNLESYL